MGTKLGSLGFYIDLDIDDINLIFLLPQSENLNPIFHTRGIPYVIVPAGMGFKFSDGVSI